MLSFKEYIQLNEEDDDVSATKMEKIITIAYNGGYNNSEVYGITPKEYASNETIAKRVADDIKKETKIKNQILIHYGAGSAKMIAGWGGKSTPKTDMYTADEKLKISLKQKGKSQLMSGLREETRSVFKAACNALDKDHPTEVNKLVDDISKVMKTVLVPGNVNTIIDFLKGNIKAPKKVIAKTRSGKEVEVKIDKAELDKTISEIIDWQKAMNALNPKINKFFNDNIEFRKAFVFEAATGREKFKPEPKASPNWLIVFDDKTGNDNTIVRLSDANGNPSAYIDKLAAKAQFNVWRKTGDGKRVNKQGKGSTSGRLTVSAESYAYDSLKSHLGNLLTEETLTEESILSSIYSWFKNFLSNVINTIKTLAKKGLEALLEYLGFDLNSIEVKPITL
jgi:hypothetical protein